MGAKASFLLVFTMLWWSFGTNANPHRGEVETVQSFIASFSADVPASGRSLVQ